MKQLEDLTPRQIVEALDKYVIGQNKAKKAVAIALRNRIRRQRLPEELIDEVAPKNIIMIGSTGVGKTEIARRLSKLTGAPFIKVEATKYTEVGYVGRDVESMVRDLMMVAINMVKSELQEELREEANRRVEEQILDLLLPLPKPTKPASAKDSIVNVIGKANQKVPVNQQQENKSEEQLRIREKFRKKLKNGEFEDKEVEISVNRGPVLPSIEIFSGQNFEELDLNLGNLGNFFGGKKRKKSTTIAHARDILLQEEMDKMVDSDRVSDLARERVEQLGIIFIDEIDKIATKDGRGGVDVSREGVQRDILPIVEGSKVNSKFGVIDTAHILFIAAGAFHTCKPSDLIPELQGRFPIRVELEDLNEDDFYRILTQPQNALTLQYTELMKTEGVVVNFTEDAIRELSRIATEVNHKTENIGARRLHTIMELLLEELSFNASEMSGQTVPITKKYVIDRLQNIVEDKDLSRYIL